MSGTIFLGETEISVSETGRQALVPILRTGDLSTAATVQYSITGNEATAGQDFVGGVGTVTFAPGQDRLLVPVQILDDTLSETTETVVLSITNVEGGFLQAPRTIRIDILDNENPVTDPSDPPLTSPYTVTEQVVAGGLNQPMNMEFVDLPTEPAGSNYAYVAEKGGAIKLVDLATGATLSTVIDLAAKVNNFQDRGLLDIVVHPDFPATPYIYAFYVVDPSDTSGKTGNAGPDGGGNRYAQLVRFTLDAASGYRTVVPGSETIILGKAGTSLASISGAGAIDSSSNFGQAESGRTAGGGYVDDYIKLDSRSHAGGALAFGPDGALYVSIGDGTSYNFADPRSASVQSLDSLSGKILRIDASTGQGLADNPFVTQGVSLSSNRAKVYQLGLRNPYSIGFDGNGRLIISDTGWNSYEEINTGGPGANFGWPYFEGGDNGVLLQASGYNTLPGASAFYAAVTAGTIRITPAYRAFAHASAAPGYQVQAITGGNVAYTGDKYPSAFLNDYFFTDVSQGEVFSIDLNDQREVNFLYKTPTNFGPVHFTQGDDGYVYYVDLVRGHIGRLLISGGTPTNRPPVANDDAAATAPGTPLSSLNVLANDSDPDGLASALKVSAVNGLPSRVGVSVAGGGGGRFTINQNGTASFDPGSDFANLAPGESRVTSIAYAVSDASGAEDTGILSITVTAPAANGSQITIAAAGETGSETMQLLIGGQVVATYANVPIAGATYTFRAQRTVGAGEVRIAFVNDRYDPQNGIDYNLRVDKITIDGRNFETEAASVFSTGTWQPGDAFGPGYGRGEWLHGNGYFQYADPVSGSSSLSIYVRGQTGNEQMQLLIDGQAVATYDNISTAGGIYTWTSPAHIDARQVRVAFTNDRWDPANGIDYNLIVDKIVLDGTTYQTEAASVLSTGTWRPEDGIVPGYGRGEWLSTNGYFQYA